MQVKITDAKVLLDKLPYGFIYNLAKCVNYNTGLLELNTQNKKMILDNMTVSLSTIDRHITDMCRWGIITRVDRAIYKINRSELHHALNT